MGKFYKLTKDGRLRANKNGEFIKRDCYDTLARRERLLRADLTLSNLKSKLLDYIGSLGLGSPQEVGAVMMTISFLNMLENMLKDNTPNPRNPELSGESFTKASQATGSTNIEKPNASSASQAQPGFNNSIV